MRHLLVVANQTLFDPPLRDAIREEIARGPTRVTLLVPAVDPHAGAIVWDEHRSWREAEARMQAAIDEVAALGVEVRGRVGGHDALAAALDTLREEAYDAVIVATLPPGLSRWLGMDLPTRIARATGLPVRHVVGEAAPA